MVNKNIDSSARGLIILVIVAFIGVSIWCLCLQLDLNRLTSPAIDGSTVESRINLDSLLASKGLKLECANYSQKDVLAYNLTCEKNTGEIYSVYALDKCCYHSRWFRSDGSEVCGNILNSSATIIKQNDKCLKYELVNIDLYKFTE